jgi:hypothetical protein
VASGSGRGCPASRASGRGRSAPAARSDCVLPGDTRYARRGRRSPHGGTLEFDVSSPGRSEARFLSSSQRASLTTRRAGRSAPSSLARSTRTRSITSRPYLATTWNRSKTMTAAGQCAHLELVARVHVHDPARSRRQRSEPSSSKNGRTLGLVAFPASQPGHRLLIQGHGRPPAVLMSGNTKCAVATASPLRLPRRSEKNLTFTC